MTTPAQSLSRLGALTLLMVSSLTIMVVCVIVPGLPSIAPALGVSGAAGWLVTLPSLGVVLFAPIAGRMIDRTGARTALCIGLGTYGVLGLLTPALHGIVPVLLARNLLGGATALVMSGGTGLIAHFYSGEARMAMIAGQEMAIELGGVIFLSVGGLLATLHWSAPFALYALAFVFLAMVLAFVPATWPTMCKETVGAPVAEPSLTAVYVSALLSMICFFAAIIALPFRLPAFGLGEGGTGYLLSFVSLVAVGAAAALPLAVKRVGERRVLFLAYAAYAAAHLCFCKATGLPLIVAGSILLGVGFGLSVPLVNVLTVEQSLPAGRGRNLATLSMAIFLGQFLASFTAFLPQGTIAPFLAAAILALVASALSMIHPALRSGSRPKPNSSNRIQA